MTDKRQARRGEGGAASGEGGAEYAGALAGREPSNKARIKRNFRALLRHHWRAKLGGAGAPEIESFAGREREASAAKAEERALCAPIIPKDDMHGFACAMVIAIMSFLAAWMLFAAYFIGQSAQAWSGSIAREAVVQIMPVPGQDMAQAQRRAEDIAESFSGVASVRSISAAETQRLLAPWLGAHADIAALPVPRLVVLRIAPGSSPDFDGLNAALQQNIKGVRFDRQQAFAAQLAQGAHIVLGVVFGFLFLVLAAMVLTVIFATRGALAGNAHIIEVLHFIGADDRFIARRFDAHFFRMGLKGACLGGFAAGILLMLLFMGASAAPEAGLLAALFGRLTPDWFIFAEIAALIAGIAALTMATSHCAIMRRLYQMDEKSGSFFADIN